MIELQIPRRAMKVGGFEVGRVLPWSKRRMVGPFTLLDHLPVTDLPRGVEDMDVLPHPHIGLATITYLFAGEIVHRDSVGSQATVSAGDVAVMSAGRGITHSERFEKARAVGDRLGMLQAWIALPDHLEESAPSFVHHVASAVPSWEEGGVRGRLVAGSAYGLTAPGPQASPLFYVHLEMRAGARASLPDEHPERALHVVSGEVEIAGRTVGEGETVVLGPGPLGFEARRASCVVLLGGEPVGPRFMFWNFVSSSQERIRQAAADWRAGRMRLPDLDDAEFIPLTKDYAAPPPPNPLS